MTIRKFIFTATLLLAACGVVCAQVSLDECISWSYDNYPQIKEMDLIEKTRDYDISNASRSWLPQLGISGKASWQSEVVELPFDIPGMDINIPHDQYSIVAELSQQIWDGGAGALRKEAAIVGARVKSSQLEVNLYAIRSRVRNVFLGIILLDKQIAINELLEQNLQRQLDEMQALLENGMVLRSDIDQLSVSILSARQQRASLEADRSSYVKVLSLMTGCEMQGQEFVAPTTSEFIPDGSFSARPEIALYDSQLEQNALQLRQLNSELSPRLNLSLQGAYGRPGMNMLSGEFSGYFIAGLKLQWNLGSLYTRGNDKRKIQAEASRIELGRKSFLLNSSIEAEQKSNEIAKARDVLERDAEIIALREKIRLSGESRYREGTLKMNDYLSMLDEEYKARLNQSLHEVQLMMAIYDLKNTTGQN